MEISLAAAIMNAGLSTARQIMELNESSESALIKGLKSIIREKKGTRLLN